MWKTITFLAALGLVAAWSGSAGAQPYGHGNINLGGVNLNAYCTRAFGSEFKSVLVGKTAGDWTCERNPNDRRPISVETACRQQYGKANLTAQALNWNDPLSWRCFEPRGRPPFGGGRPPPTPKGVNLNYYCQKTFGSAFKSVLVGKTAGDWTCERNQNDRRQISVKTACVLQYGNTVKEAKALNWNDPLSWVCVF